MAVGKVVSNMITDSAVVEAKFGVGTTSGTAIGQWHIDQISINGDTVSTTSNNNHQQKKNELLFSIFFVANIFKKSV